MWLLWMVGLIALVAGGYIYRRWIDHLIRLHMRRTPTTNVPNLLTQIDLWTSRMMGFPPASKGQQFLSIPRSGPESTTRLTLQLSSGAAFLVFAALVLGGLIGAFTETSLIQLLVVGAGLGALAVISIGGAATTNHLTARPFIVVLAGLLVAGTLAEEIWILIQLPRVVSALSHVPLDAEIARGFLVAPAIIVMVGTLVVETLTLRALGRLSRMSGSHDLSKVD